MLWEKPIYKLKDSRNREITIDVTRSVSAGLKPAGVVTSTLIPFFLEKGVSRVLDFGAGALRHTIPLLDKGFEVCAVEFDEVFKKPVPSTKLALARSYHNFTKLVFPKEFISDNRKFDGIILSYVLQVMPKPNERKLLLKYLAQKMRPDSYLFYSSRYNEITLEDNNFRVNDGFYRGNNSKKTKANRKDRAHSFYTEFLTEDTHQMFRDIGLQKIRSLGERGNDQIFVYVKGKATWA